MHTLPNLTSRFIVFLTPVIVGCLLTPVFSESNSKGPNSLVVVGALKGVDSSGTQFEVLQDGDHTRKLYSDAKTKVYFIGLPNKANHKPMVGYGVKASSEKDGRLKSISFTPEIDEPKPLGAEKLAMSATELFARVDRDDNSRVGYAEFSETIYYSPKHGPDSFRKADKDSDGELNLKEFAVAVSSVSWWKLSRKTPDEWFTQADKNRDGMLDIKEFASICTSGNHIENIFKRTDGDESGSLTQRETAAYIRSVTHGKQKSGRTRKRDKQATTQSVN
jgi:Ca2+-binding EF-hand superfamily protein